MKLSKTIKFVTPVLILMFLTGCVENFYDKISPTLTPKPPIDLSLKDLQGEQVSLRDLRGKVVLVNFWASWCSPCREEMPFLDAFYQAHRSENFMLVAINVSESAKDAAEFVQKNGFSFTVWSDPPGDSMIDLGINGLPASLLLDETGSVQKVWFGPLTEEMLDAAVLPLLN